MGRIAIFPNFVYHLEVYSGILRDVEVLQRSYDLVSMKHSKKTNFLFLEKRLQMHGSSPKLKFLLLYGFNNSTVDLDFKINIKYKDYCKVRVYTYKQNCLSVSV